MDFLNPVEGAPGPSHLGTGDESAIAPEAHRLLAPRFSGVPKKRSLFLGVEAWGKLAPVNKNVYHESAMKSSEFKRRVAQVSGRIPTTDMGCPRSRF
jgi:hypothetical protein